MIDHLRGRIGERLERLVVFGVVALGFAVGSLSKRGFDAYRTWIAKKSLKTGRCGCANRAAHARKWLGDVL